MIDLEEIKQRIKDQYTQEEFARLIGENQQTVSAWFSRGNIPKGKTAKVLNALKMDIKNILPYQSYDDMLSVRIATVEAGASHSFDIDTVDEYTHDGSVVISNSNISYSSEKALVAIKVNGKSMLPTLLPNDMVIIDLGQNRYVDDDLYVFNYAGNLLVKRLQYNPSNNSLRVISDNRDYEAYSINLTDDQSFFKIVGRVIATISR